METTRHENPQDLRKNLYDLLDNFDTAMLITRSSEGHMHARPMAVAELRPDVDAYFVTSIDSPKVMEINANSTVTLSFQSSNQFASICGSMSVVRDQALVDRLWKEAWKLWFPKGKSDPTIAMLKFDAQHGEYWDNAGVQGLKFVFKATKAYVQGERLENDDKEHAKVDL